MDSYREHPSDFDAPSASETPLANDVEAVIGTDERRMHVRAYNYWVSLLAGRDFPSIEDLESTDVGDFSSNSVLLDFTCSPDNPAIPYVGSAIRDECAFEDDMRTISEVPSRSLLSRLTDHYMQIIANRAPVGFEAEFENPHGKTICYRGILMPFSSDGEQIDFIYGVINWKHVDGAAAAATLVAALASEPEYAAVEIAGIADADDEPLELTDAIQPAGQVSLMCRRLLTLPPFTPRGKTARFMTRKRLPFPRSLSMTGPASPIACAPPAKRPKSVKAGEGRTRAALYKALSLAYDFAVAAQATPDEYAELLENQA